MENQDQNTDLGLFLQTFKSVLLNLPVASYILDLEGNIVFFNDAAIQLTGYQREKDFKRSFISQLDDEYIDKTTEHFKTVLTGESLQFQISVRHQNGHNIPVNVVSIPLEIRGLVQGICGFILDQSDKGAAVVHQRTEIELTYWAFHDPLTGLPNRLKFDDELCKAINEAKVNNQFVGILFIDIDRFKDINDSLGHKIGDQLIQIIANRLKNHLRSGDVISRQGGDEFVILLKNLPNGHVIEEMAARISQVVAQPIPLFEHEYRISVSIGTSIFPEHGEDGEVLMMRADHAMYLAKENRTGIQQYQIGMSKSLSRKMLLEQYLHQAIEKNELYLEYQPIFDVNAKKVIGLEALLRWEHPVLGSISPVEFIQIAEESDLIIKLSVWVLSTVCSQRRLWLDKNLPPFYISVNVPARQIQQDDFIESIKQSLQQYNLPPELLKIEITERTAMTNVEKTLKTIRELQEFGVDIILDDFGIGYSSISYLVQYPFNTIKIDKSFIQGLNHKNQKSICRALVAMGRNLGMNVVAEGVEEMEQYHYLCSIGCYKMQGYYFSRPISVDLVEMFF